MASSQMIQRRYDYVINLSFSGSGFVHRPLVGVAPSANRVRHKLRIGLCPNRQTHLEIEAPEVPIIGRLVNLVPRRLLVFLVQKKDVSFKKLVTGKRHHLKACFCKRTQLRATCY